MRQRFLSTTLILALSLLCIVCTPQNEEEASVAPLVLDSVAAVAPFLDGSPMTVVVSGTSILDQGSPTLILRKGNRSLELEAAEGEGNTFIYLGDGSLIDEFGAEEQSLQASVMWGERTSSEVPFRIDLREQMDTALTGTSEGPFHWNDKIVFEGTGFLYPFEGSSKATLRGMFTTKIGEMLNVDHEVVVLAANTKTRSQGTMILLPQIAGAQPGTFRGSIDLRSKLNNGHESQSSIDVRWQVLGPEVFLIGENNRGSLEELVGIGGAGFIEEPGSTRLYLEGEFINAKGKSSDIREEIFATFEDGQTMRWRLDSVVKSNTLISSFFGDKEGKFNGTLQVRTTYPNAAPVEGVATPVEFTLAPVVQVVWIRFSENFKQTLTHFGLHALAPLVESQTLAQLRTIFKDYRIDIRAEKPTDFHGNGFSIVDVEGDNPNGGLDFGLDATPGKDINNLRLHDLIGGVNAATQADGQAGYGGVFINSFLAVFSSHPSPVAAAPSNSRAVDPLFDEVFDPVRSQAALPTEISGKSERSKAVQRALRAFSALVANTVAHEIGHSLGLANPHIKRGGFHNSSPGKGCLMDSGGSRPLEERLNEPGASAVRFCSGNASYMKKILGK